MKPRYEIAGEQFSSAAKLAARVRAILWGCCIGQALQGPDYAFMLELLKRHPGYEQKKGSGILRICVRTNPVFTGTRGFWLVRSDGSETDFSYRECISPTKSNKVRFVAACRTAVEASVIRVKKKFFNSGNPPSSCPYTGELLTWDNSHVDHAVPYTFKYLVEAFIAANGIDVESVRIHGDGVDNAIVDRLVDKVLEKKWIVYHDANARLRVISRKANLDLAYGKIKTEETPT